MTTITLKNIKEVDSIIEGIFDNYSSNIPEVDICDASIDDLVENADAMGAGDLKEEIASVIVGKSDFKEMIDAAYLVAILRDHAELQGSWEIRSGLYLQTLENLQSEGFDFDFSGSDFWVTTNSGDGPFQADTAEEILDMADEEFIRSSRAQAQTN